MEKDEIVLLNPVKMGAQTSFSKLIKAAVFISIAVTLVFFIVYYVIIGTDNLLRRQEIHFRRLNFEKSKFGTQDFKKLFNITDFKFTIRQSSCSGMDLDLLVLVHSAPDHYGKRQIIRHTWANQKVNSKFGRFRVLFLLGATANLNLQKRIITENLQFKDIVQGSFTDHYRNLTYKHVMGLKWISYFCDSAKIVLKVDDDVFVNMPFILQSFETTFWEKIQDKNENVLLCNLMIGSEIIRDNQTKWYVSEETIQGSVFPPYCSGFAIFYGRNTVRIFYEISQMQPYLNIDDAFVTGIVREKTDINITEFNYLEHPDIEELLHDLRDYQDDTMRNFFIGPFEIDVDTMQELWDALLRFMKLSDTVV